MFGLAQSKFLNSIRIWGFGNSMTNIVTIQGQRPLNAGVPWDAPASNQSFSTRLTWRSRWSKFLGRDAEMAELRNWANTPQPCSICIIEADGGYGKTRLAAEFATALQVEKKHNGQCWQTLWISQLEDFSESLSLQWGKGHVLVVVDYPEHSPDRMALLLRCVASTAQALGHETNQKNIKRLRLLLLCRQSAPVKTLLERNDCNAYTLQQPLQLQALPEISALALLYESLPIEKQAWVTAPENRPHLTQWLNNSPLHSTPLFLAALALCWSEQAQAVWHTGSPLLQAVIEHEAKHWSRAAQGQGMNPVEGEHAMMQVHAFATLMSGLDHGQLQLLAHSWGWTSQKHKQVLNALGQVFPSTSNKINFASAKAYSPMQPDLLAAQLLVHWQSIRHPAQATASHIHFDHKGHDAQALHQLLTTLEPVHAAPLLQRWNMLCYDQTVRLQTADQLENWLITVLQPPFGTEKQAHIWRNATTTQTTWHGMPRLAVVLSQPQGIQTTDQSSDDAVISARVQRAQELNKHAYFLANSGARENALTVAQEAVDIYLDLLQAQPQTFRPDLAQSLRNLAARWSDLGQHENALDNAHAALNINRQLHQAYPQSFAPHLAANLGDLANYMSALGQRENALAAAQEAVDIFRLMAQKNPNAFEKDLTGYLSNLANRLSELGNHEKALPVAQEAIDIRRRLALEQPHAFEPDLAASLNNLAILLIKLGQRKNALALSQESVTIRRRLAMAQPEAFEPVLARSLKNQAELLSELDERENAMELAQEAVGLYQSLSNRYPQAFSEQLVNAQRILHRLQNTSPLSIPPNL
ncbi:hypothetical protein B9Z51_02375 [Limnohabitans sp. T6-5]|nr:hypothetical protein B9Z51_02375 [Limnohabitans sp. T6-5]